MAKNKKPAKKYRPREVLQDPVHYVLQGFRPLTDIREADVPLRVRNHLALEALMQGRATMGDLGTLITASNVVMALKSQGFGEDCCDIALAGADALEALQARGRLVGTGPELVAIKRMMELHDAQLDRTRITDLDAAVRLVRKKEAILV